MLRVARVFLFGGKEVKFLSNSESASPYPKIKTKASVKAKTLKP